MEQTLFESKDRTNQSPQGLSESTFSFLDRSADPEMAIIRDRLNFWIKRFPPEEKGELYGRIQSGKDEHFNAGLFELFLHEVLLGLGSDSVVRPSPADLKKTAPDFLVTDPSGYKYYLEAISPVGKNESDVRRYGIFDHIIDRLNTIVNKRFIISVDLNGNPQLYPSISNLERFVRNALDQCDVTNSGYHAVAEMGSESKPPLEYHGDGFSMRIRIYQASQGYYDDGDRIVACHNHESGWGNWPAILQTAIEKKANKYGKLEHPFVLAVNPQSMGSSVRHDLSALFGSEQITGSIDPQSGEWGKVRTVRSSKGSWIHNGKIKNTRVSCVLMVRGVHCWNPRIAVARLYHHPQAVMPFVGSLCQLPQAALNLETGKMEMVNGRAIGEVVQEHQ